MCNGTEILIELNKAKSKPLFCKINSSCWCMQVQTRFEHTGDDCMSPAEMLAQRIVKISASDRRYLEPLAKLKFIRMSEQ